LGFHLVGHRRQIALAGRRRLVDRRRLIALVALHGRLARLSLRAARRGVGAGLRPRVLLLAAWRLIVGAGRLLAGLVALRRLCLQPEQLRQLEIVARAGLRLGVDRRLRQALIVGANGFGQERLVLTLAALQDGVAQREERPGAAVAGGIVEAAAEVILGL